MLLNTGANALLNLLDLLQTSPRRDRLHLHHPVLEEHKQWAFAALWSSLAALPVLWFLKSKNNKVFQYLFLVMALGISFLLVSAAHEGGEMVYEYGVRVSR